MTTPDPARHAGGVLAGVATNMLWALAIVMPVVLAEQSALALTLGRYTAYGLVSLAVIAVLRGDGVRSLRRREWGIALVFAAAGNVGYYFLFVLAVANAGAPLAAAIIGALPITVALYGNWRRREFPFGRLLWPIALLVTGLLLMNVAEWDAGGVGAVPTAGARIFGMLCALTALGLWTWYAIANAAFLKSHPLLRPGAWSTAIGVATLALVIGVLPFALLSEAGNAVLDSLTTGESSTIWRLIIGSLVLGVAVSWGGTLLWNIASERLPVALAGQLIVLETVAGMAYIFAIQRRVPSALALIGVALLVGGVLLGIRRTRPQTIEADVAIGRGCDRAPANRSAPIRRTGS